MTAMPSANDLYRAAQILVKQGQPIFPCYSKGERAKRPMTKNGWKDATLDLDKIKRWWSTHRDAAIGTPTGVLWDVLDVDVKDGRDGREHLTSLQNLGLLDGCKRIVRTPSKGYHLYFRATPGLTNKAVAALGLDVRSKGGYVIAPPSGLITPDYAGLYEEQEAPTGSVDAPLLWDQIIASLAPVDEITKKPIPLLPSERRASLAALREWVANREPGERNHGLFWAVCRCIDNGLDPHELVEPALLSGLTEEETLLTIGSALKRAGLTVNDLESEAEAMFGKG